MPPRRAPLVPSNKADIQLALLSIDSAQIQSTRRAATVFDIPKSTLIDRRAGKRARRDCQPNSRKLTQREEEVIVSYILHLDQRGFAPTYAAARDMADKLLAARGAGQVRQKWPANFVKRTDSLRTCFNQAICDEDIYNFDKASFIMGKITTQLVITGAERRGRPKTLQLGNRDAAGWSVPPFLIFAGQYHLLAWYEEAKIPRDWAIAVSDNSWTNNKLRVEWLKHFNAHTQARTIGARRLLIIDGHKSYQSLAFQELCKENNIYTLSFRGAGLVPLQPEAVLSKLDVQLRTPTPPAAALPEAPWVAQTPSNARELKAQSSLIRKRVRQHKSSSPALIIEAIN
ncbi:hypothetical protein PtrM4_037030 [Pyrenophora tritici-repentis]|uniref:HTH CENPB-type domain-containing protein n=1 Tax=Pyrenophora tritici-repentis TaxID=45151 RepID=A0A834SB95_9PLEO|nr:hypothetical protein PtrM4_037030 [Pyrenophora tritici-repentis]